MCFNEAQANEQIRQLSDDIQGKNRRIEMQSMSLCDLDQRFLEVSQMLHELIESEVQRLRTNVSIAIQCAPLTNEATVQADFVSLSAMSSIDYKNAVCPRHLLLKTSPNYTPLQGYAQAPIRGGDVFGFAQVESKELNMDGLLRSHRHTAYCRPP